jgi:hypothetical protein
MLTRWNPWRDLFTLEKEMSDLTSRFFGSGWSTPVRGTNGHTWTPAVDVFSRDGNAVARFDSRAPVLLASFLALCLSRSCCAHVRHDTRSSDQPALRVLVELLRVAELGLLRLPA